MGVMFLLVPLSVLFAAVFLGCFIWAVRSGQYEDTGTPSLRLLLDEPAAPARGPGPLNVSSAAPESPSGAAGIAAASTFSKHQDKHEP